VNEAGLFVMAEASETDNGYDVWFDEIKFETVPGITNPRPAMRPQVINTFVGANIEVDGTLTTFDVDGSPLSVGHSQNYFDFFSSADSVVTVDGEDITVVGPGTAMLTAKLDSVDVFGQVTVNATAVPPQPAPTPTYPAGDVIALFSNPYEEHPVNTWLTEWSRASLQDIEIQGDDTKVYTSLVFAGIEYTSPTVDATDMTHFRIDAWAPAGTVFRVKLVDFGPDDEFGGGDDSESEVVFSPVTEPPFETATWLVLDIPFERFAGLIARKNLAQLVISGDTRTVYVDNVLFHR
jgi:hypothetical protein